VKLLNRALLVVSLSLALELFKVLSTLVHLVETDDLLVPGLNLGLQERQLGGHVVLLLLKGLGLLPELEGPLVSFPELFRPLLLVVSAGVRVHVLAVV
jgi:hypothetical protein